ncbi:MAG: hypothetical protein DRJ03_29370 [Chloroflexi bacterium]|nr:MAG: hypothetical protein DRJ03_29370 [Chloroflexota bacterium]
MSVTPAIRRLRMDRKRTKDCIDAYINLGWQVLPLCYPINGRCSCGRGCEKPGKAPHGKLSPNGAAGATKDPAEIERWFASGLNFNIGVCAGTDSGLVILDVDPAHGGTVKNHTMPNTPAVTTGSGGEHYYFKHPGGDIRNSSGTIGDGLDVRGHNGYVVAPPSLHACGQEYRWSPDPTIPLAEMPAWIVKRKKKGQPTAEPGEAVKEGGRNDTMMRLLASLCARGVTKDTAVEMAQKDNETRYDPPLDDGEIDAIAESIYGSYTPNEPKQTEAKQVGEITLLPDDLPSSVAKAFYDNSEVKHRYNMYDGWSIYCRGKYQQVPDIKEIRLHIRKFITKCRVNKKKKTGDEWITFTEPLKRQTSGFITDVLEALASQHKVHLLPSKKAPCCLDGVLDAGHIIAANNTLIDISHRPHKTHPITRQFYTLNYLDYDYIKDAYSERFAKFLIDITKSDVELMVLLQQWAGYLLMPTLKYQKFLLCVGNGANGKGVFFDTLTAALGRNNVSNVPLGRFDHAPALFGTYNKRVNMSNESAKNMTGNGESVLKEFVAGDKVLWEQKYKDAYFDYPTAKLMFATNELPRIQDTTDGIWRRMLLVPFDAKFEGQQINPNLGKELQEPKELAGILNWMVEGAEMLIKDDGFIRPRRSNVALEKYRDESNSARLFLKETVEVAEDEIGCRDLYESYQKWCEAEGFKPRNSTNFGKQIAASYKVEKVRKYDGGSKRYFYQGITLQAGATLGQEGEQWQH